MKRTLALLLAALLLVTFALTGCSAQKTNLKLATGSATGTYYAYGAAFTQVLSANIQGLTFDVQSTGASKANIYNLADGEVDMGIVQNDVADYAYRGVDLFDGEQITDFVAIAGMYAEVCQVVGTPNMTSIADLKGKRVSVGDIGSGTEFNAKQILSAYGISFDDITVHNLSFGDSATAFKDGKIDAFFCTAGAPTTAIVELATTNALNILAVDDEHAAKLIADYPFYTQFAIPRGSYKGVDADVMTVAVKATLVCKKSLSDDLVYKITKALFEKKADITTAHPKGAELDAAYAVAGISIDFHPGAAKYFKEVGAMK
ncbi:MAG: TAXI family TRAP transporter solute-binding subunit [Clostridiales bacterium]|jgi:TRAP transporter TAXI family solute receptor|nr:TAXI family TRAP transporter solute-binding subunit [Clostridiales bacterium]